VHVIFRATEVLLRVLFFATYWWMFRNFFEATGVEWIAVFFITDYLVGLCLLKVNSPPQEKLATHILMAMMMLVSDLTHFVDQPNFTVPAQRISKYLSAWRLVNMAGLICVSYVSGKLVLAQCAKTKTECDAISSRSWLFEMRITVCVFLTYCILRFSPPIRRVGDDLHTAARVGRVERLVKLLAPDKFNQVLDVNAVTKDGTKMTPAMFAASEGFHEALRKLAEAGADLNMTNVDDESCLHMAARRDDEGGVYTLEFLLRRGVQTHLRNKDGFKAEELCRPGGLTAKAFETQRARAGRRRSSGRGPVPGQSTVTSGSVAEGLCDNVPLVSCGSVLLRGLFPDAEDNESPSPRALDSVSGLVFSRAAGLLARKVLSRNDDDGQVPIGALRKIGELGKGGFGHVIEVELPNQKFGQFWARERENRRFALKLQMKEGSQRSAFCEVLALRTVSHRFIVRLERAFQTPKYFALLLELCPNDLNRILCEQETDGARCTGLSEVRTAKYLGQILLALKHLHEMDGGGIVYRDVKPENILISQEDDAKLTDFGLAKVVTPEDSVRMTMCGTMGFFPPEVLNCDLISESDGATFSNVESGSLADRQRVPSEGGGYDAFKLDAYSYGVTLQLTLLGEDGANRKEIRKKGPMMLPFHHSEEENIELLQKLTAEGKLSKEALDLLVDKLLPHYPSKRQRLGAPEVVNHNFFLQNLECKDLKDHLMKKSSR
jgi:serine/threonine protein kinase